jgi:anti-sigma factor RsiW
MAGRSGYEQFAAQAHRDYARGAFPLDVASSQPQVVSDWLEPRVPFHLTLPNYPEGGPKRYTLAGARLMQYRGEDVAYLAYEMDRKPISLLISSSSRVMPSGGETYQSGGLTFYFASEQGLRIITWRDRGLTYAQVSDLDVKGAESCVICHGAEGERRKFEGLGKRL